MTLNIALIGYGAIASRVASGIRDMTEVELVGALVRTPGTAATDGVSELNLNDALERADLFVECAGVPAVTEYGPNIIAANKLLLLASVGALADPILRRTLLDGGPGRVYVTNGAIGGLDILASAALEGGLDSIVLETRKAPASLIQPWMDADLAERLRGGGSNLESLVLYEGGVSEAIEKFPANLNVSVALAHATNMWDHTIVKLIADPTANLTKHTIHASGRTGTYQFEITNNPLPDSPSTSGVVVASVLRGIRTIAGASGVSV
ncbi:aspartate dehydrogenase domain-containing protein [Micrococcoides hystricis]|uniref:L-aspartate dehydrogenase n=1 Tax=Micrococcoides hystricis TaxID=1572761 RepID=A0ABV6PA26_9MICC